MHKTHMDASGDPVLCKKRLPAYAVIFTSRSRVRHELQDPRQFPLG